LSTKRLVFYTSMLKTVLLTFEKEVIVLKNQSGTSKLMEGNGCQYLCWKVHDRAQSFILHFTMHELRNQNFLLVSSSVKKKELLCLLLCIVKAKKENKNIQQRTLSDFITIPLY